MRDEPEKVNAERWNAKKTEGCDGCLFIYFTRPLITGSGWVLWYDGFTAAPRAGRDSRAAPPSTLVLHRSCTTLWLCPPLNLTEDLTDKMFVHVNKNNIVGFVFEHSFQWYNFRWHASSVKQKWHGSCRWFLARSDDGERLMIIRMYRMCCFAEYNHSHYKVFEQDPGFSGPSGIFD